MTSIHTRIVSRDNIEEDRATLRALQEMSDYRPLNGNYTIEVIESLERALQAAEINEQRLFNSLAAARDNRTNAAARFHDAIQGAKVQVKAQYGSNSNELQSMGLKKRSEYKRPVRRKKSSL